MIQYKLIKEYPGSPELKTIEWFKNNGIGGVSSKEWRGTEFYDAHPQFWEKVEELDYEILGFFNKMNKRVYHFDKASKSFCSIDGFHNNVNYDYCVGHYDIHSVKRLSDGEVFTVGDVVDVFTSVSDAKIKNFEVSKGEGCWKEGLWAFYENGSSTISQITKSKKNPLFTTEEEKEIINLINKYK